MKKLHIVIGAAVALSVTATVWASALFVPASPSSPPPVQADALAIEAKAEYSAPDVSKPSFTRSGRKDAQLSDLPDMSKYEGMDDQQRAAAIKTDLTALLDKKVASGHITQAQADRILGYCDKFLPMLIEAREGGPEGFKFNFEMPERIDADSDALPGTHVRLGKRDGEGFRFDHKLPDLSKYEDMDDEQRAAAMKADLTALLDKKVAKGGITQEQADKILEQIDIYWPVRIDMLKDGANGLEFDVEMPQQPDSDGVSGPHMRFGLRDEGGGFWFDSDFPDLSKYVDMDDEQRTAAIKADITALLEQKVADGSITQSQADRILGKLDICWPARIGLREEASDGFAFEFDIPELGVPGANMRFGISEDGGFRFDSDFAPVPAPAGETT